VANVAGGEGKAGELGLLTLVADSGPLAGLVASSASPPEEGVPPRVGEPDASLDCGDGV